MMNIFQSVFLILRSFTQCRACVYRDSLQRWPPGFPTRWVPGPHDGHRRPMKRWSVEEFYEGNHWMRWPFIGASPKMGPQQIREYPIRKEGQTVKKRWQQKDGWSVFSLQTFFHGNQTLMSVLVQKWLWIGVCVRTWFTTLWFQSLFQLL